MQEFKEREKRIKAEKIETSADVYRIAEQMEASYVDEKTFFNENGSETQFTIAGPRFGAGGREFTLALIVGMWLVEDNNGRRSVMSDREFRKTYVDLKGKELV